jgi:biotin-dependent carboxylase-like uncharacterized protein
MTTAMLRVHQAGPLVTIQDSGRPSQMRFGVPASGPMDPFAHRVANAVLGRPSDAATIEISVGGLMLECEVGPITVAICGGGFRIEHNSLRCSAWTVVTLHPGDNLRVAAGDYGSWCYLAFSGSLEATRWLSSCSTHVRAGLGGRVVTAGTELIIHDASADEDRDGPVEPPIDARPTRLLRVVLGPQPNCFGESAVETLLNREFTLTAASDRMGVRLNGPTLPLGDALSIASTPIVRGSLQVAGDGTATLLLADHQTTGGYPKIATVLSDDTNRATQLRAGDIIRFERVEPHEAIVAARTSASLRNRQLEALSKRPGIEARQLLSTNLIGGIHHQADTDTDTDTDTDDVPTETTVA